MTHLELPLRNRAGELVGTALINRQDEHLARYRWCMRPDGYVVRRKDGRLVRLHREVLGLEAGDPRQGEHVNLNPLDCRRSNLLIVDGHAANCQNRRPRGATSRFRGVYWDNSKGKYMARATLNYRSIYLGRFHSEVVAGAVAAAFREQRMPHSAEARA